MESVLLSDQPAAVASAIDQRIAEGKDGELLDGMEGIPALVEALREHDDERADGALVLYNAGAIAAIAARRGKSGLFTTTVEALLHTYRLGDVTTDAPQETDVQLFEATAAALWSLGASLMAEGRFQEIRTLVELEPVAGGHYDTWFRHGQVMSARNVIDPDDDNILDIPARILQRHTGYGLTEQDDTMLDSLFGFDLLAMLVVASDTDIATERLNYYPSFAKGPARRSEWVLFDLRTPGPVRDAIFPKPDEALREVLTEINALAASQAAFSRAGGKTWDFRGFEDARTWAFVREGNLWEEWQSIFK